MQENFFSEDGVDRWCAENLKIPERGFYVDVGCAHPLRYSNTAWLRARGWTGLAIDGTPEYAPEWAGAKGATFINAIVSNEPRVRFLNEPTNALVSRIHVEGEERAAVPLSLLTGNRYVHFLSIDIEGHEAPVMEQFLKDCLPPGILVCEFNSCHLGRDPRIFGIAFQHGMKLRHLTDNNAIFTS